MHVEVGQTTPSTLTDSGNEKRIVSPKTQEAKRRQVYEGLPVGYSGYRHFLIINVWSIAVIAFCLWMRGNGALWEWTLIPLYFTFANLVEWLYHKGPLHTPTKGLIDSYKSHAGTHHVIFTHQDMAVRDHRDLKAILFSLGMGPVFCIVNAPIPLLVGVFLSASTGWFLFMTGIAYYLVYEWLHLLHHWPPQSWLGRRRLVGWLREHHRLHHDPRQMTKGNFNVSFPLWDHILGTCLEGEE